MPICQARVSTQTGRAGLVRIQRQPAAEKAALEMVGSPSFGLKRASQPERPGNFRLRARTHPVDFLLNSLPRLAAAGFEIYGEEKLKTARVNRSTPTMSFSVASGIDWFDVKTVVNFGDVEVAFKDIRRALRKRERYIKLLMVLSAAS
jgi:non-specific serine/threonine protein kinase